MTDLIGNRVRELEGKVKDAELVSVDHLNTISQFRTLVKDLQAEISVHLCSLRNLPHLIAVLTEAARPSINPGHKLIGGQ